MGTEESSQRRVDQKTFKEVGGRPLRVPAEAEKREPSWSVLPTRA